jgi:hypothetical protein
VLITAPPRPGPLRLGRTALPQLGDEEGRTRIESEIVIVDDDGTEEPFDPASWCE